MHADVTQYCLRRLRFLLIRILAAAITLYCKQTAVTNVTSKSAILEVIVEEFWTSSYYRPTFYFFTAEKPTGVSEISSPGKSADLPASGARPLLNTWPTKSIIHYAIFGVTFFYTV